MVLFYFFVNFSNVLPLYFLVLAFPLRKIVISIMMLDLAISYPSLYNGIILSWKPLILEYRLQKTFQYSSGFWSDKNDYNLAGGKTGFDNQETKLPSYWETRFSKICLGMRSGHTTRFVVIDRSANSLYAFIADGRYRALSLGRNKWKSLIGSQASLQRNCNKEGFNVLGGNGHSKARIGIVANQEHNCLSCDSRIGFGTGGYPDDSNTCGNEATIHPDNGDKHIKAMGYILVQWFPSNLTFQVKTKQDFYIVPHVNLFINDPKILTMLSSALLFSFSILLLRKLVSEIVSSQDFSYSTLFSAPWSSLTGSC